jgi:hypothetical protein
VYLPSGPVTVSGASHVQYSVGRYERILDNDILATGAPQSGDEPSIDDLEILVGD